jgi:hypothetical protein
MRFSTLFNVLASAALAAANSVTFISQDWTDRTIIFTPNAGLQNLPDAYVPAGATVRVDFPHAWIGNWFAVSSGAARVPGMLGEVAFNGWNGMTYFDVSAIVNPNDHVGVKEMFPAASYNPVSGCKYWPCNNAYYLPDDVQTKTTYEADLICTLGHEDGNSKREVEESENVARSFVLGGY